jgi:hypothetical protein
LERPVKHRDARRLIRERDKLAAQAAEAQAALDAAQAEWDALLERENQAGRDREEAAQVVEVWQEAVRRAQRRVDEARKDLETQTKAEAALAEPIAAAEARWALAVGAMQRLGAKLEDPRFALAEARLAAAVKPPVAAKDAPAPLTPEGVVGLKWLKAAFGQALGQPAAEHEVATEEDLIEMELDARKAERESGMAPNYRAEENMGMGEQ